MIFKRSTETLWEYYTDGSPNLLEVICNERDKDITERQGRFTSSFETSINPELSGFRGKFPSQKLAL